jgi:hypothetical protein
MYCVCLLYVQLCTLFRNTLLPIRPYQPCCAGKSQPSTGSAPAEQPPFSQQSDPLTRLATSKLPQQRVYLIHIAATPAVLCSSVTAAHWEARILVLVRNCRGRVNFQGYILENLLNVVRIRRDNKDGVLHKTTQDLMI